MSIRDEGRLGPLLRIVRHPHLRRLEVAFAFFAIAENATWITVIVFAFARGGVGEAGVVMVVQLAPAVVVAPFAAYAGDRFRKDLVLAVGYVAQSACMLGTAVAMWAEAPAGVIYGAATLVAVAVTFTRPAMGALLPAATSSPADLIAANVSVGVLEHLGVFLGPAVAGVLLQGGGQPSRVFAAMGGGMALAALSVARLRLDPSMLLPQEDVGAGDVVNDAVGGFRTLRHDADLRLLVFVLAISTVVTGAADVLFVAVADGLFDDSDAARAGLLGAAFGLGALAGALGSVALVGRSRLALPLAVVVAASGTALALMGGMSHLIPVIGLFIVAGAGDSVSRIAGTSLVQRVCAPGVLSRVFGVMEGLQMAALAVGAAAVSLLVEWLGLRLSLLVVGLAVPALLATRARQLVGLDAATPSPRPALVQLVLAQPMFAHLPAPTLERLLSVIKPEEFAAGVDVVRQGDEGDRYFLVESGELAVTIEGTPARSLGPGDGFGEIALVREVPRTATVTTRTPTLLQGIARDEFLAALSGHPGGLGLAHRHAQRLLDDDASRGSRTATDDGD